MAKSKKSRRRHGYAPRFETSPQPERPGYTMQPLPGGGAVWIPNPRGGTSTPTKAKYYKMAREEDIAKIADRIFGAQSFFCYQELEQENVD